LRLGGPPGRKRLNFSLQDKLLITQKLDDLGVDFIEGGYPLSNPKDAEYFQAVRQLTLKHAKVAAFGMTRRKNARAEDARCRRRYGPEEWQQTYRSSAE
jgi:2-isopropylmalate synthase